MPTRESPGVGTRRSAVRGAENRDAEAADGLAEDALRPPPVLHSASDSGQPSLIAKRLSLIQPSQTPCPARLRSLAESTHWNTIPLTVTSHALHSVLDAVSTLKAKASSEVAIRPEELLSLLCKRGSTNAITMSELMSILRHLELHGHISLLDDAEGEPAILIYPVAGYLLHSGNPYMLWSRIAVESERCRTTTRPAPVRWTRRQHGADSRSPRQDPPDTWPRSQLTRCRSHWRPSPPSGGGRSLAPNAALSSLRRVEAGILAVTVTTPGSSERHARRLTAAQIPEDFGESRERANHYMLGSPE